MTTLNFPPFPIDGDIFTQNDIQWQYDAVYGVWNVISSGPTGYSGSKGYTGSKGLTYIGNTAPLFPVNGDTWYNTDDGIRYVYYVDFDSSQWVQESAPGPEGPAGVRGYTGSASTAEGYSGSRGYSGSIGYTGSIGGASYISNTAPSTPSPGDTWYNSDDGVRYIYYIDANATAQWVQESAPGPRGYTGSISTVPGPLGYTGSIGVRSRSFISNTAPTSPENGDTWYNSDDGVRYIYYIDANNTAQWVQETSPGPSGYTGSQGIPKIPLSGSEKTSSYQLTTSDVGKLITVGAGGSIVIPDATFTDGDIVTIFNNTSGNVTITCNITTAYIAGVDSDKASVTLATRGKTTVLFISGTLCVMDGNVS